MVKLSSDINLRDFGNNEYLSSVQDEAIRFATEQTDEILSLYGQQSQQTSCGLREIYLQCRL